MDEIEHLVVETYKHFYEHFPLEGQSMPVRENVLPEEAGLLYHIQKTTSVFVIRSLISNNIREDYQKIMEYPEHYPSLRLLEGGNQPEDRLRFFVVGNLSQAEIINDHISNRRFPVHEEKICNLSDPGFSWWLTKKRDGFQLSFTLSIAEDSSTVKLGPLGEREVASRNFQLLEKLMNEAGLKLNVQNEINRVQLNQGEDFLLEELKDLFEFGVMSESLQDLFKILAKRITDSSSLETLWLYFQEIAAMRRFWIQITYDLSTL